jgi:hypothetical protein
MSFLQANIVYLWLLPTLQIFIPLAMLAVWITVATLGLLFQITPGTEPAQEEEAEAEFASA